MIKEGFKYYIKSIILSFCFCLLGGFVITFALTEEELIFLTVFFIIALYFIGTVTKYYLNGTNIIYQTDGTDELYFFYDKNDELIGFNYEDNNYFYIKNGLGVITDIADENGNIVVSYEYDPWGDIFDIHGNTSLGRINPFRYKSYYYDNEIGWYYLQSRYYYPIMCRFINCDDVNYIGVTGSEI